MAPVLFFSVRLRFARGAVRAVPVFDSDGSVVKRVSCPFKHGELFFPLQSPGTPRGGGKNYKIPLPGPTPETREKLLKDYKNCIFCVFFGNFSVIFPHLRRLDRGGEFVIFPHFSGISALEPSGAL